MDFQQTLQDNIGDIAGSPSPVQVKIFGPDQAELETLAQQVDDVVAKTPGVVDDFNGIVHSSPETVVTVDSERAQRYGLTTDDMTQAAQAALLGAEPTPVQRGEEAVAVRVTLHPPGRRRAGPERSAERSHRFPGHRRRCSAGPGGPDSRSCPARRSRRARTSGL